MCEINLYSLTRLTRKRYIVSHYTNELFITIRSEPLGASYIVECEEYIWWKYSVDNPKVTGGYIDDNISQTDYDLSFFLNLL